jgi:hypothetical protein
MAGNAGRLQGAQQHTHDWTMFDAPSTTGEYQQLSVNTLPTTVCAPSMCQQPAVFFHTMRFVEGKTLLCWLAQISSLDVLSMTKYMPMPVAINHCQYCTQVVICHTSHTCLVPCAGAGSPGTNMYTGMGYGTTHGIDGTSAGAMAGGSGSPYRGVRSASSAAKEAVLGSKAGIPAASTSGPTSPGGGGAAARGLAAVANMVGPRFSSPPQAGAGGRAGGGGGGRAGAATSPRIDGKEFFRQAR